MCSVLLTWVSQKQLLPLVLMQCRWRKQLSIAAMAGDDWRHPVGCCWRRTAGAAPIISSSRGFGDSLMRAAEQPVHVSQGKHGSGRLRLLHHRACTNKHGGWCLHPRGTGLSLRVPPIRGQLTFHSDTLDHRRVLRVEVRLFVWRPEERGARAVWGLYVHVSSAK